MNAKTSIDFFKLCQKYKSELHENQKRENVCTALSPATAKKKKVFYIVSTQMALSLLTMYFVSA